ncbi:MAG: translation initiation factor IF-2 [Clostridiales bacterium]|nr:translation initiation factor IF-2 [Clostridiales bacterium]
MSDTNENKQPGLIVGGVSGKKEMRVRRVHKKKADAPSEGASAEAVSAPSPAETAPVASEVKAPVKEAPSGKEESASVAAAEKATEKKAKAAKPAPEKEKKAEAPKASASEAKASKSSEKKTESAPAKAPSKESEAAPKEEAPKTEAPAPRSKISSAVVQMPEVIRSTTVFNNGSRDGRYGGSQGGYRGGDRRGPQSGDRGGYRSGPSGRPAGSQGGQGGYRGDRNSQSAAFAKDKDDDQPTRPQPRKASKPKTDSPIEEVKKSRANFAERNAIEKKRDNDQNKRDNGKNAGPADRRNKNNTSGKFSGRISEDGEYDDYSYGRRKKKKSSMTSAPVTEQVITDIQIPPFITVKEFAEGIGKKSGDVIKELMKLGVLATINQELDFDTACLLADAFGINATLLEEVSEEDILFDDDDDKETEGMVERPPVVVVMGHVDHGKTSLLDRIRSASVVSGEAGGITQHIGAYTVRTKGRQITFLDTPGHEAFTTMRARGANFTDIAILVVAADDGVMPQTIESINHAKAAGTEIVVAINKIDKPGANPDKVKQELTTYELVPEEWGGSTIMVPVSAKQGIGIDDLLENVLLVADVLELKADPTRQAKGAVIEAKLDKARGPVATVLVQRGTLRQGDTVVCGAMIGNVRAMYDDKGKDIKKAGPSMPVEILGLPEVPEAGETLYAVTDDKMARQLVEKRKIKQREEHMRKSSARSLESLAARMAEGDVKELNLIIKADVQGSVEAVTQSVEKLSNEEVRVKVIHGAVGAINESDVMLADVSNAIIIGFNVRPNAIITEKAKEAGVDIKLYSVIYNAIEDLENAMKGMLAPKFEEVVLGHVEIRELFKVSGVGTIGGCYVTDGKITRNCGVRVLRDDIVIYTGQLGSLQRMKDSVKEVNTGYECGLTVAGYNDIKIGDVIEAFEVREVARD